MSRDDLEREFRAQAQTARQLAMMFPADSHQQTEAFARENTWHQAADRLRLLDPDQKREA